MLNDKRKFLYGFIFGFIALIAWGSLPIALKLSTGFTDPITFTWLRFLVAFLVVFCWQLLQGKLSEFRQLALKEWLVLAIAGSFLIINYTFFAWSVNYLHPGTAQLTFQLAPFFLAIGGVVFLKERIHLIQWLCFLSLAAGILIFFHPTLTTTAGTYTTWLGIAIVQISAIAWSIYALLQKSLFSKLSPTNILLAIYGFAAITMLPFSSPADTLSWDTLSIYVAIFCCFNTLVAYGAFAKAMGYWQTVQVSAIIALTPIASFSLAELFSSLGIWPDVIESANMTMLSLVGLIIVIISAVSVQCVTAMLQKRQLKKNE